ncbi:helix-turn-helix domain-containing protein [Streptomyces viridosporus]|uniref:helix-turn-helix domain-containing protein n=1 Tax=Streptomyces viridosporus TaxID=67581 RepID=UPI0009C0DA31|nr:helix-turn-helix transcriptional regulator [Streptomyces viridosporus]
MAGDEFSELLGRLKERSGLSYGVLGKRLHTSASTLHRYVNGDAVPTDYAPVERFARVCRATPEELVELHRRWVLADARRRQKAGGAPAKEEPRARTAAEDGTGTTETGTRTAEAGTGTAGTGAKTTETGGRAAEAETETTETGTDTTETGTRTAEAEAAAGAGAGPEGERRSGAKAPGARRRSVVVLAGAAVVVSTVLVANLVLGDGDDDPGGKRPVGAASRPVDSAGESPGASESADAKGGSASPSASHSGGPTASASTSASRNGAAGAARGGGFEDRATAPTVAVNPYKWEGPCSQHYLIDRKPEQVPPPPSEPDARGWVTALGGVAGGQQMLALTVQGTGRATVVLEELHVRVVEKSAPLAWNDFVMGVGCGGVVETTAFGVDLDAGRPALSPQAGQRDFPYKVSESDPEVFHVFADARAHNVSWYLELVWSSGDQRGTVRIDDHGKPFRTSGNTGRPAYTHPLGAFEWGRDEVNPDVPG